MNFYKNISHIFELKKNILLVNGKRLFNKNNYLNIFYFLFLYVIFFINTLHEKYPDEFDNILGGWYILHGKIPYLGFFTHHGPIPYYVAAFALLFSGRSFVYFRIIYSILLFLLSVGCYKFISNKFGNIQTKFYLGLLYVIGIAATYFWGHMLLADSLSGFLLMPVLALLILKVYHEKKLVNSDFIFISLLTFFAILCSLTYIYLVLLIYFFSLYFYFFDNDFKIYRKQLLKLLLIFITPYVLFLIYLIVTRSLSDYAYQAIVFNEKFYIYNYPRPSGSTTINPVRFAIIIAYNFYINYTTILQHVKDFNLSFPFQTTLAIGNMCLIMHSFFKRKFALAILLILEIVYSSPRSNPLESAETDYQDAVYIMLSLFNCFFILSFLYSELKNNIDYSKKIIFSFLLLLLGFYSFFTVSFLFHKFLDKAYFKYMGQAPLIYDRPELAPIINSLISNDDYVWVGPFEFEELFYTNGQMASKYHILIPGIGHSEKIQSEMIAEFSASMPKIIWFDKHFYILGSKPETYGVFFIDFLNKNYLTLNNIHVNKKTFVFTLPMSPRMIIQNLYIRKDSVSEALQTLINENLVRVQ